MGCLSFTWRRQLAKIRRQYDCLLLAAVKDDKRKLAAGAGLLQRRRAWLSWRKGFTPPMMVSPLDAGLLGGVHGKGFGKDRFLLFLDLTGWKLLVGFDLR